MKNTEMKQIFEFLSRLAQNNDRQWFAAHKPEFDILRAMWLEQLQQIIGRMAIDEPSLRNVRAADCAYRIYRDTRFSHDKTPYKTYFSAAVSPVGRRCEKASWYFHFQPGASAVYGGIWAPEPAVLRKLRKAIVDNIEEFRSIIDAPGMVKYFPGWWGPTLKTAPKGYDRNHPDIDLLRLTSFGKECEFADSFFDTSDWIKVMAERAMLLKPLIDFLNYSIDEDV